MSTKTGKNVLPKKELHIQESREEVKYLPFKMAEFEPNIYSSINC